MLTPSRCAGCPKRRSVSGARSRASGNGMSPNSDELSSTRDSAVRAVTQRVGLRAHGALLATGHEADLGRVLRDA